MKIRVTGRLFQKKDYKYYHAILNLPNFTSPKWISTKCDRLGRAEDKLEDMIEELELRYNHPDVLIEESVFEDKVLYDIFPELEPTDSAGHKNMLLIDYLRDWEKHFIHVHRTTKAGYRLNFDGHILPYFENNYIGLLLSETKRRHIQAFINYQAEEGRLNGEGGVDKESITRYVANISVVLRDAVIDGDLENNPCNELRYPQAKNPKTPRLSFDWLLKLLDALKYETIVFRVAICFAIFYALRRGEIYGLCYSDIKDGVVNIERAYARAEKENFIKDPKNEASRAPMPLLPAMAEMLEELKQHQAMQKEEYGKYYNDNDFIFKRPDGNHYNLHHLNDRLQKIIDWNGIPKVTVRGLRHSTATLLRAMGFEAQQIQSWLRHADLDSTEVYAADCIEVRELPAQALNLAFVEKPDNILHIRTQLANKKSRKGAGNSRKIEKVS